MADEQPAAAARPQPVDEPAPVPAASSSSSGPGPSATALMAQLQASSIQEPATKKKAKEKYSFWGTQPVVQFNNGAQVNANLVCVSS